MHIIISYPDAGLGHCPEGQGPDIKISFLTLFDVVSKLHQINPIYGCKVKISADINPRYIWFDGLSWWLQKGMTIVCRSYVIGHKFINPIYECGVK